MIDQTSATVSDSSVLKQRANAHIARGEWDRALESYREACALDPRDADLHVAMGFVLQELGRDEEAAVALQHSIELSPNGSVDAHYLLGSIARRGERTDDAIAHFERALTVDAAFAPAHRDLVAILMADETRDATTVAARAAAVFPASGEFQFYLGVARTRIGELDGAVEAYQRALALEPRAHVAHLNLARLYVRQELAEKALDHFEPAVRLGPSNVEAHIGLIGTLNKLRRYDKAVAACRTAMELAPDNASLYALLGTSLYRLKRHDESLAVFARALELAPHDGDVYLGLANVHLGQGRRDDAIASLRKSLALRPHPGVEHMLASLTGEGAERAPDDYVATLFDQYAESFDAHLVGVLKYDVPQQLADAMRKAWQDAPRCQYRILDLGCGTGLMGVALEPFARQLTGVDLSARMLDKARSRDLYARLERADLAAMMSEESDRSYDAIVAADVFVYIGKLDELCELAFRLLVPGGLFAFSVESADVATLGGGDVIAAYRLEDTGRYVHARAYLEKLAASYRFDVVEIRTTQGRVNLGVPVAAYLAVLRRPAEHVSRP